MSRTAIEILSTAFAASLKIVQDRAAEAGLDPRGNELVAASNLAICLFSFEVEAASLAPPDENDDFIEGDDFIEDV